MFYDLGAIAARLKPFNAPAADVAAVSVFEENAVFGASRFLVIRQTAGYPPVCISWSNKLSCVSRISIISPPYYYSL